MHDLPLVDAPKVSVIIPTYNHQDYVLQTLESVFAQTYSSYEVIVINDGSPDKTGEVLQPVSCAGRIRYVEQVNAGQATARNRGLKESRGEFVAFLDDDDLWPADKLEWQVAELDRSSEAVAVVGQCEFIGDENLSRPEVQLTEPLQLQQLLLANAIVSPGQSLIRRSALEAISGFGNIRGGADDWDCWIRLAGQGKIMVSQQTALLYRLHVSNASRNAVHMLDSARNVAVEHTSASTNPPRAQAIRSLLECAGLPVAHQTSSALGRADLRAMMAGLRCLLNCVVASGWDKACVRIVMGALLHAGYSAARSKMWNSWAGRLQRF